MALSDAPAAIERWFEKDAPKPVRKAVEKAGGKPILSAVHPYATPMKREAYERAYRPLQIELVKLQTWIKATGARVAIVFEGRDAAGKGGLIQRLTENLNPRGARVVALAKPSDVERGQWYFQRYVAELPSAGEIVFFDRSWYNRGVVEHVFGFCAPEERERFFAQVPEFERMLVGEGIRFAKIWLTIGRAEQLRRMLDRARDPLKQWKLSPIDVASLERWDAYSDAIRETFRRSHTPHAPWRVIRGDDKRRARLEGMRRLLSAFDYDGKDPEAIGPLDPALCGPPEAMPLDEP
ncbi:MAG: polyphosphate kinase 2 [Rhodobacteraceae bacterium]|nr:MAG: polyphosphate kinase 2 [Paracoccaceae bacterium]